MRLAQEIILMLFFLVKKYQGIKGKENLKKEAVVPTIKSTNPLDNLDCEYQKNVFVVRTNLLL